MSRNPCSSIAVGCQPNLSVIEDLDLPNPVIRSHYGRAVAKRCVRDNRLLRTIAPGADDLSQAEQMVNKATCKRLILRAVLRQVSPMVIRLISASNHLQLPTFHDVFRASAKLVRRSLGSWLRTVRPGLAPSELVVAVALRNLSRAEGTSLAA